MPTAHHRDGHRPPPRPSKSPRPAASQDLGSPVPTGRVVHRILRYAARNRPDERLAVRNMRERGRPSHEGRPRGGVAFSSWWETGRALGSGRSALQVLREPGPDVGAAQLAQRLGLDLADPLAADPQLLANVAERLSLAAAEPEAQPQHGLLALGQGCTQ